MNLLIQKTIDEIEIKSLNGEHVALIKEEGTNGRNKEIQCICSSDDGSIIAVGYDDDCVRLYHTGLDYACQLELEIKYASICSSSDGSLLVVGQGDGAVRIYSVDFGYFTTDLLKHTEPVTCVCFSPSASILVTSGFDARSIIWDLRSKEISTIVPGNVEKIFMSEEYVGLLFYDQEIMKVVVPKSKDVIILQSEEKVVDAAFFDDGLIALNDKGCCMIWSIHERKIIQTVKPYAGFIWSMKSIISKNGKHVLLIDNDDEEETANADEKEFIYFTKDGKDSFDIVSRFPCEKNVQCVQFLTIQQTMKRSRSAFETTTSSD